jgi:RND family efflux transporter MFP subunit
VEVRPENRGGHSAVESLFSGTLIPIGFVTASLCGRSAHRLRYSARDFTWSGDCDSGGKSWRNYSSGQTENEAMSDLPRDARDHEVRRAKRRRAIGMAAAVTLAAAGGLLACNRSQAAGADGGASDPAVTVGVAKVARQTLNRRIRLSSELVPFQEIDVYAKESGYVKKLYVDYGTRVKAGQIMATLEIPELEAQLQEDEAEIANASDRVKRAQHELRRYQAQYSAVHLQFTRLNGVFETQPGIVAQQEVDDARGKDEAAASEVDAGQATLQAARSSWNVAKAKRVHDQALYDYSKITAPFSGVVTERYANLGALVQAGTTSTTSAMPIVKLSEDNLFRLVIPVPESYVRYIRIGAPVDVRVPSLNRTFPGKVARFSVDVKESTRTMHTEVDVPNPQRVLVPGIYAEAELVLEQKADVPTIPLQAVNHEGEKLTAYVVNQGGRIEDRPLTLGLQNASEAEVLAGVAAGEQVVVSDRSGLKPGEAVHPQPVQLMSYHEQE